ncbi:MAG TPA: glycosyltransferase family 39 protein [Candidatus Paceibacterota bacterium]|nr:glycosyltransferase family 39 protein [Candidatus Paceibacterota bacterium]
MVTRIRLFLQQPAHLILVGIILLAFGLRIVGIFYALPLTSSISDEPSLILGALQMIQLKTVIPALNPAPFAGILYYPPYLSYIFLTPFIGILGFEYLSWHGGSALFSAHLLSDLSLFFIAARLISIAFTLASVWLLYRIAQSLFSRRAALVTAFLFATSLLDIGLSMVARHWVPATFFFVLVLYILTRTHIGESRRYFWALVAGGIGVGVSPILILTPVLIFWWWLTQGTMRLREIFKEKLLYGAVVLFALLCALPSLLYKNSNGFAGDGTFLTSLAHLDIHALLLSPVRILLLQAYSEPVLIGLFLAGLITLVIVKRPMFYFILGFFLSYCAIFFSAFRLEARFMLPLLIFYTLAGGFAFDYLARRTWVLALLCVLLCIPLVASVRFSMLAIESDTRAMAREWVLAHTADEKVIVDAPLMRISATADAVAELRAIDASAVRRTDEADESLSKTDPSYGIHALNLFTVNQEAFFETLPAYWAAHGYNYLIFSPSAAAADPERLKGLRALAAKGALVASWEGLPDYSMQNSAFTGPFTELFSGKQFGPDMVIYKLR